MLALFLTQAAAGSLLALLLIPPRAGGRGFFRYTVGQSALLLILGVASAGIAGSAGRLTQSLFVAAFLVLLVSAGLFHLGRLGAGFGLMAAALAPVVAGISLDAMAIEAARGAAGPPAALYVLDALTAGLVSGSVLIAMILGHYYLNIPGLSIGHLQRLALLALSAIGVRAAVLAVGIAGQADTLSPLVNLLLDTSGSVLPETGMDPFVIVVLLLQLVFGLAAPAVFLFMAWRTARISSTQSATGILYVSLIMVIMGELSGRYLVTLTGLPI